MNGQAEGELLAGQASVIWASPEVVKLVCFHVYLQNFK